MLRNKRGAGEDIWIIIAIVIGVLALVLIAVGFTTGWSNLWTKFNMFSGGKGSLSSASEFCTITCGKGDAGRTAWCSDAFEVKGLTDMQVSGLGITYDSTTNKFMLGGAELAKGAVTTSTNVVVAGLSNAKKTVDVSGVTCNILNEKILTQKIDCDLSC